MNEAPPRLVGGVQAAGGLLEVGGGAALVGAPEPTLLTKPAGVLMVAHGLDDLNAGLTTVRTGEVTPTFTYQGARAAAEGLGASPEDARWVGIGTDLVAGIGPGLVGSLSLRSSASVLTARSSGWARVPTAVNAGPVIDLVEANGVWATAEATGSSALARSPSMLATARSPLVGVPAWSGSMTASFAGGTGGFYQRFNVREALGTYGQEADYSCGLACDRELLRRHGIVVSEPELISRAGLNGPPTEGLRAFQLSTLLREYLPNQPWVGGVQWEINDEIVAAGATPTQRSFGLPVLLRRSGAGSHWVILESLSKRQVNIWDPWGLGAPTPGPGIRASLTNKDFFNLFQGGGWQTVAPKR